MENIVINSINKVFALFESTANFENLEISNMHLQNSSFINAIDSDLTLANIIIKYFNKFIMNFEKYYIIFF